MKKALLLVVAVLLVAGSLFAATSTKFSSYGSIFKKGEFTLTGKVYEIPSDRISKSGEYVVFRNMPILDSPFLIAEKRLLHLG